MQCSGEIAEHLQHIRTDVDALRGDMREVILRLDALVGQFAGLSRRFSHLDERFERLEHRLASLA